MKVQEIIDKMLQDSKSQALCYDHIEKYTDLIEQELSKDSCIEKKKQNKCFPMKGR